MIKLTKEEERRVGLRRSWNTAVLKGQEARKRAHACKVEQRRIEAEIAASYERDRQTAEARCTDGATRG